MNIVHVCLSCFYIDGFNYQENELVRRHVCDGHNVLVIASTENMAADGRLIYQEARTYQGIDGARVIRLDYRLWPHQLARKLRIHSGVYRLLSEFQPDAMLFHGCCGWEITTVARYAKQNPQVLFYIDSHEDWNNSARAFISRELLHKLYYRACLSRAWPITRKILCISTEAMEFVRDVYGVPREHLELFPLGGRPIPDSEYSLRRRQARVALGLPDDEILFLQSGKQTKSKKLIETLTAFEEQGDSNMTLAIAGIIDDEIKDQADRLIRANAKVIFLGWKSVEELTDLLCATDVYVQPGTQSVTMQHSLCCRCAVIIDDVPAHQIYVRGNGWLINRGMPLERAIGEARVADLPKMQQESFRIASSMLDYAELSKRVLRE
jgi:hypothetical protein